MALCTLRIKKKLSSSCGSRVISFPPYRYVLRLLARLAWCILYIPKIGIQLSIKNFAILFCCYSLIFYFTARKN